MSHNPTVSVLIPIRNESHFLEGCLQSVIQQEYQYPLEIIIIDGLSTDDSPYIVHKFVQDADLYYRTIIILDNPKKIVPIAMNIALPKSRGEIIIRIDGHCIIDKDYVKNCVNHLMNHNVDGVGGPMETIGENEVSKTIAIAMSSQFGVGNSAFRTTDKDLMEVDTIAFPAYKREIIEKVGLYDEELVRNQDDEYNYRIREMGGKLLLASDVRSKYYSRGSYSKLWKQYYQYGYWKVRVLQKHPLQMSLRQFVPPIFVLALLLSLILTSTTTWGWITLSMIAGSYLLANLAASIYTARKKGWEHVFRLPLVFPILHISYGSGFLVGLFKFWNRWGDKVGKVPPFHPASP